MSRPTLEVTCKNCSNKYDLNQAVAVADKKKTKKVVCPHCHEKVGRS